MSRITLILEVEVDDATCDALDVADTMKRNAEYHIGNGMLTDGGDPEAIVDSWTLKLSVGGRGL